ncbi:[LysW]-lysine hydrolase [Chloroflexus sp.]|uniref:[LysW]-lysine hydrolase n=1 Tax=Chloroflexus sp. TaxID=1904827 RepID=UPI00262264D5|nr:[LysW]-lysine hydrolase [uncultured Chloroflexus sp.]
MNDALHFLIHLLRTPSLSGQEEAAARVMVDQMASFGWEAFIDESGSAVGHAGTEGPLVVLLGHIDTVPGDIPVRIEDGKLYGRGAVDAKGPLATFVWAARQAELAGTLRCRLVIIGATEEEAASSRGAHAARDRYRPDFCVIGEPSGWDRITLGYKGRLLVHYRYQQSAAHSAGEQRAAPEQMVDFWQTVVQHCQTVNAGRERLFDQLIPSLRRVHSESDGMNEWVEATIGLRLPPGIDPHILAETLRALAGPAEVTFEGACPAFQSSRATPLASAFLRAIRRHGGQPAFLHKTGTADMNVVGPVWQCPIVAYGPGDSRLDHTPTEHVEVAEYERAIAVLADVLAQLR